MHNLRNQDGAALVTALLLTMLALIIALSLLYTVNMGTRVSASQKRYKNALAAANGGVEVLTKEIIPLLLQEKTQEDLEGTFSLIELKFPPDNGCLTQKLNVATANWTKCSVAQSSADPTRSPDLSFSLSALPANEPGFAVSTKIVDTVPGNSDKSGIDLDQGSSVAGNDDGIRPQHVPAMFNLSVQGTRKNTREKASLSVLYAY